ncbi:exonuclease subunit SbcD [Marinobacterium arenosum]|uniref:exonuclease subunit SbcD n=1 Tax=Marinobacterium arenosum TaxID=2862496 RepID=UPI001C93C00B|nr:exonuclease subunit SbcD [Marinobacterium arenosum]MBY4677667.1 exonuclease subunit SbcD [Marinobacterium arenosum]
MRILHTSDWHLGQHFMGKSREAEHRAFLDWLLEQIERQDVDALIVAGDIFDTGTPPSYARALYNQFVVEMRDSGCQLVILGGNHDSVATLHESRDLLACLGTQVIGGLLADPAEQVLQLNKRDGSPGALLCAVPFLRPRDLLESRAGQSGEQKQQALLTAVSQFYQQIFQQAEHLRDALEVEGAKLPIIATGHLTTVGGQSSESVRDIYIGSLDALPVNAFPPADYIALGHLHRAQQVGGQRHIRYSGSPIPLSFDELSNDKQVLQVDFEGAELKEITPLAVPRFQPMARLKGSLAQIEQQLAVVLVTGEEPVEAAQAVKAEEQLGFDFLEPEPPTSVQENEPETATQELKKPIWLEVEVAEDDYLSDLQNRVEAIVADKPVELLRVRRQRKARVSSIQAEQQETLAELSVEEVFSRRLAEEALSEEQLPLLHTAFAQVVTELEQPEAVAEETNA